MSVAPPHHSFTLRVAGISTEGWSLRRHPLWGRVRRRADRRAGWRDVSWFWSCGIVLRRSRKIRNPKRGKCRREGDQARSHRRL